MCTYCVAVFYSYYFHSTRVRARGGLGCANTDQTLISRGKKQAIRFALEQKLGEATAKKALRGTGRVGVRVYSFSMSFALETDPPFHFTRALSTQRILEATM